MIRFTKEYEEIGVRAAVWQDLRALVDRAGTGAVLGEVKLENDLPAGMEVFADPLIVKVFFNLIDNALRHGGRITTIRFAFEARNGDRIIICEDDGDGVTRGEKERIFERGFGKNTGFGLAISREIPRHHRYHDPGDRGAGEGGAVRDQRTEGCVQASPVRGKPHRSVPPDQPVFCRFDRGPFSVGYINAGGVSGTGGSFPPQTGRVPSSPGLYPMKCWGGRCRMTLPGPGWGKPGTVPAIL